jgi:drug/metabolite transporter (DMT)-like permease
MAWGIEHSSASNASILSLTVPALMMLMGILMLHGISVAVYMLPVFGLILSALTLGERIGAMQYVGGAIVLASAYLSTAVPPKRTAGCYGKNITVRDAPSSKGPVAVKHPRR